MGMTLGALNGAFAYQSSSVPHLDPGLSCVSLDSRGLDSCAAPESMARSYLRDGDGSMEVAIDGSRTKPLVRTFQRA
eukprot:7722148-Pyramimonas_sp.AAC.1